MDEDSGCTLIERLVEAVERLFAGDEQPEDVRQHTKALSELLCGNSGRGEGQGAETPCQAVAADPAEIVLD